MKQFMNQVFGFVDKNLKWLGLGLLGTFYLLKVLVIIGQMAAYGSVGYILVGLIDLVIISGLVGADLLCLFTNRKQELGKLAIGYLTYFVISKALSLGQAASEAAIEHDALLTTSTVFVILGYLAILGVLVLYVLEIFFPKFGEFKKYIGFAFLGYFALMTLALVFAIIHLALDGATWFVFITDINEFFVLPLLVLGMYFVCANDKLMGAAAPAAEPEAKEEAPVEEAKPEEKPAE